MINFERFNSKSIYGGNYYMDNSYKILLDNNNIGVFHFMDPANCEFALEKDEMYIEYIELFSKGHFREVLNAIFSKFPIKKIFGETDDDNKLLWSHIGAKVDEKYSYDEREIYNFTLFLEDLIKGEK